MVFVLRAVGRLVNNLVQGSLQISEVGTVVRQQSDSGKYSKVKVNLTALS